MSHGPEFFGSEQPALLLLQQLGYHYLPGPQLAAERPDATEVLLSGRLRAAIACLNPQLNAANQARAYDLLATAGAASSLLKANEATWKLLRVGSDAPTLKQEVNGHEEFLPVHYLDFAELTNNDWLVVNQPRYQGRKSVAEPDIVLYINGISLAVLECKAGSAVGAWDSAYKDLAYYQHNNEQLFHYNVVCVGLYEVDAKYAAICTPQSFYASYRDQRTDEAVLRALLRPGHEPSAQDRLLFHLLAPAHLLDVVRHFVLFECEKEGRTVKKLPRYQQVRAVNRTLAHLRDYDQGGVVWHTQGSGKSLTMAYLIRKLWAEGSGFDNPTVLVLTDRTDLDRQITTTFQHVGFKNVQQATSVRHLDQLLRNDYGGIITTTLQKFQQADKDATDTPEAPAPDADGLTRTERHIMDNLLVQITKALRNGKWEEESRQEIPLEVHSNKTNLYVLVDEAHRSHYGFLAAFMRSVLPNAKFIAFTGTPISREDKSTLAEFYGQDYLDTYTIIESVADGATALRCRHCPPRRAQNRARCRV